MSSFSGTTNGQADAGLQLAPVGNDGPDHALLSKTFSNTLANLQGFFDQCEENFNTRYALWSGQSADGKKHAREGAKIDPTPWDGASDLQVFLTDEAIIKKVAMLSMAFRRAGISATPVEGNDIKRAKTVANFMRWMVQTQIPEVSREVKLLANFIQEQGIGAIGTFWEETQEKILTTVTLDQLQAQSPEVDLTTVLYSTEGEDQLIEIFVGLYECSRAKAKKMLAELRKSQTTTVPTLGRKKSRPVLRAFNLNQNLFIPAESTDPENCSAMFRVEYYTAEQLRGFVNTSNWDEAWVEAAINTCRGQLITNTQNEYNQPMGRSFTFQSNQFTNLIGVVFAYQRLSDEDGNAGIYLTVFNPKMGPDGSHEGYAKTGLLGYAHGQYPFTIFRREHLSRKLHDSRGIPEPGKPLQQQIKVHKDSLIDNASMQIMPPLMYPQGRPPLRWGAGARIAERRPGEYHFGTTPAYSPSTEASYKELKSDFNGYLGFATSSSDPTYTPLITQDEADEFLIGWNKVYLQCWQLFKQFGKEETYYRVVGLKQVDPVEFRKGEEDEQFDFVLRFSVDSMSPDQTFAKLEQIAKIVATGDREGMVNYSEWLQVMVNAIDPTIAEMILDPKEVGQQRASGDMQEMLTKVYSGIDQDLTPGTPPDLALSVIQNYIQGDPTVQAKMQNPQDPFGKRIEKLMKQAEFQKVQQNNAKIGRMGAV